MRSLPICGPWMVAKLALILVVALIPLMVTPAIIILVLILPKTMVRRFMPVPRAMCKERAGMVAMVNILRFLMIMAMLPHTAI